MSEPGGPSERTERKTVKQWREARGLTQLQLAYQTGASLSTIASLESGRYVPRITLAQAVVQALGVSLDAVEWPTKDTSKKGRPVAA